MSSENYKASNSTANNYDLKKTNWLFTEEEMNKISSLSDGLSKAKELKLRQQAAGFIQDMGERLNHNVKDPRGKISQLCMCAAMLHMHRFFVVHSFCLFDPRDIAAACLFLAGKCEECPRKLEHIVKVWYYMKNDGATNILQEEYEECADYIRLLEGVILQTIGFDLQVEVPHSIILKAMNKIAPNNSKLTETAYYFATDILHMTDWCVRYRVRTLACVCIHLALTWAELQVIDPAYQQIPPNPKGEPWYTNFDPEMTETKLHELADEFTEIYKTCGEALAIKRFKTGPKQPQKSQPIEGPSSSSHLPPPPPPPILESKEPKQKKVGLNEYKERHKQIQINTESSKQHPTDQMNDAQKRISFIPDFKNAKNVDVGVTLPFGIPIATNPSKSFYPPAPKRNYTRYLPPPVYSDIPPPPPPLNEDLEEGELV